MEPEVFICAKHACILGEAVEVRMMTLKTHAKFRSQKKLQTILRNSDFVL